LQTILTLFLKSHSDHSQFDILKLFFKQSDEGFSSSVTPFLCMFSLLFLAAAEEKP